MDLKTRRSVLRISWAILSVALVLRLGFGLTRQGLDGSADEAHWDRIGLSFCQHGLLSPDAGTYRPPLYPLLIGLTYRLFGHAPVAVRVWQACAGTVVCALLFALGRRMGGERVGLIAATAGAVYPLFVFFSGVLMAESLLILLTVWALLLAFRMAELPSPGRAAALGVVLGLGGLCKPVLLAWLPFLVWGWWRRTRLAPSARVGRVAAVLGGALLAIAPWTARNVLVAGSFVPISTNLGINLLVGHEPGATGRYRDEADYQGMFDELAPPDASPAEKDRVVARAMLHRIAAHPVRTLLLGARKLAILWSPLPTGESGVRSAVGLLSSAPLLALGLWGLWQARGTDAGWIIGSLLLSFSLVHALIFAHTRFRLPVDAALIGPAALAAERLWRRRRRGK